MAKLTIDEIRKLLEDEEFSTIDKLIRAADDTTRPLLKILSEDKDHFMRQRAAIALSRMGGEAATEAARIALDDKQVLVVEAGLRSASASGDPELLALVAPHLSSKDPAVRVLATQAAADVAGTEAIDLLGGLVDDPDVAVRQAASQAMSRIAPSDRDKTESEQ